MGSAAVRCEPERAAILSTPHPVRPVNPEPCRWNVWPIRSADGELRMARQREDLAAPTAPDCSVASDPVVSRGAFPRICPDGVPIIVSGPAGFSGTFTFTAVLANQSDSATLPDLTVRSICLV